MGRIHFEQMREDALRRDCRAFTRMQRMVLPHSKWDTVRYGTQPFWRQTGVGKLMRLARGIDQLEDALLADLTELVLSKRVTVRLPCMDGKMHAIRDEDVFTFDDHFVSAEYMQALLFGGNP